MDDHLTLARFRARQLTANATVVHMLVVPFMLWIPIALLMLSVASQ